MPRLKRIDPGALVDAEHPPGHVSVIVMHYSSGGFWGYLPVAGIDEAIASSAAHAALFDSFDAARTDKWQRLDRLMRASAWRNAMRASEDGTYTTIADVLWMTSHADDGEKQVRPLLEAKQDCKVILVMRRKHESGDSAYVFPATATARQIQAYVRAGRENTK